MVTYLFMLYERVRADDGIGFDWLSLPEKSLVVDVGGGVGSQTLMLAKKFPQLNFVIQDTEATQPNAEKVSSVFL